MANLRIPIIIYSSRSIISIIFFVSSIATKYEPNWTSLDSRPLPRWYDEAKVGILLHWGVFSVPAFGSARFWEKWQKGEAAYVNFMKKNYKPSFTYADFASQFHAEFFDANEWANIFKASGARYVVMVTKHHEGFTLWPSNYSFNWNSYDVGPKRDLLGELSRAIRKRWNMHFGVYHSLYEFLNPLFLQDQSNDFKTQEFVKYKTLPELYEVVTSYKPDIVWSDGDWMAADTYWNSTQFLTWLYNESPVKDTVVVNDRWGNNTRCKHGGFWNCNDKFNPGKLVPHKWENCMSLDKLAWTYRRNLKVSDVLNTHELIQTLAETISYGGNLLINVGAMACGKIDPLFEERLTEFGNWLKLNEEAIYPSKPWHTQRDNVTKDVWYTAVPFLWEKIVYAIILTWPENNVLYLNAPQTTDRTSIEMIELPGFHLKFLPGTPLKIMLPDISMSDQPSTTAWVLKMTHLKNQ